MGMGEPLLNLPSVLRAHQALTRDLGIGEYISQNIQRLTELNQYCLAWLYTSYIICVPKWTRLDVSTHYQE